MGFQITHHIWDGYYIFNTNDGEVQYNKNEMGLQYIDYNKLQDVDLVQTVWVNV